jgi:pimeloyl-ACP methyl ester carboxylesterase
VWLSQAQGFVDCVRANDSGVRIGFATVVGLLALAASSFGCAIGTIPDPQQRIRKAEMIASNSGFTRLESEASDGDSLPVAAWVRAATNRPADSLALHIYIEGDGLAWRSRRRFSPDPTPLHFTALKLAAADPSQNAIVYLGRPCQYGIPPDSACRPIFWTAGRYSETVIDAMDRRIDALITQIGNDAPLTLIGYSGGGVVATLLAARRDDVRLLVTIAAPLDIDGWTRSAHISPLVASHSPMDSIEAVRGIRQHHFVGRNDTRVPIAATEAFHRALGRDAPSRLTIVEDMDHGSWPEQWRALIETNGLFE